MDALLASYASSSSEDEEEENEKSISLKRRKLERFCSTQNTESLFRRISQDKNISINAEDEFETRNDFKKDVSEATPVPLPPPPPDIFDLPGFSDYTTTSVGNRLRSFPHVEGNYALHVYIPVSISSEIKRRLVPLLMEGGELVPELFAIDTDLPLSSSHLKGKDTAQIDATLLGKRFHISLSRTVAIRVHQIESIVKMLRYKLQSQKRFLIEFGKWEVFINDEKTRTFLAMEVINGGLSEISKQVHIVDQVYKLHNLPEFYKDPRPHISVAWCLGDLTLKLKQIAEQLNKSMGLGNSTGKCIWTFNFNGIECKIGQRTYSICK